MTKTAALYNFFSGFGIDAYPATAVPPEVKFPYLTYEVTTDSWGSQPVPITVNLWYHTTGETAPNNMAERISQAVGIGGIMTGCDDGVIWIKKGTPFCRSLKDEADHTVKRRVINLSLEFLTL